MRLATGVGRWCVVSEVEAQLAKKGRQTSSATQRRAAAPPRPARPAAAAAERRCRASGPGELCVQSAAFVYALLWPTVAWRGAKWRLCSLSLAVGDWEAAEDAGVLELVALIAHVRKGRPGRGRAAAVGLKWVISKS